MAAPRCLGLMLVLAVSATSCGDLPRDPEDTLAKVRGHRLRIGVVEQPPWVVRGAAGAPGGVEPDLLRDFARDLGATPDWHWGGEQQHMQALQRFALDVVVGGITDNTPWSGYVGITAPYCAERGPAGERRRHVIATPPGENGFIKRLDEFLAARRGTVAAQLRTGERR